MSAQLARVVVGIADASASASLTVVEVAAWLASVTGAAIEIINGGAATSAALAEICRQRELETRAVDASVELGIALSRRAARGQCDLVVVGKRAGTKHGLARDLFALVRSCPCPVWLVHGNAAVPPRRILAATAVDELGARTTGAAAILAELAGAELNIVHAWKMPVELQLEHDRLDHDEIERRLRQVERELRGRIVALLPATEVAPRVEVLQSSPTRAVREAVAHLDPGLVVIGTVARSGLVGLIVGNTVEHLYDLPCSLLVIKEGEGLVFGRPLFRSTAKSSELL